VSVWKLFLDVMRLKRHLAIEDAFLVRVRPILEQVAKDQKLDVILNADAEMLLWADRSIDITNEVVKQLAAGSVKPQNN
jgi:Skp family chaperone for outer membrane proteins